jgi:AcrR family transcriptional regulator
MTVRNRTDLYSGTVSPLADPDIDGPTGTAPPSFVRDARRSQLVATAIELIAEVGVERASTVAVARRAGVSRGVLTHHFTGRDDLLEAVVAEVYAVARKELAGRVASEGSPRQALLTFVRGSIDFYAARPDHMQALHEIFSAGGRPGAPERRNAGDHHDEAVRVGALIEAGRDAGELRADLDPRTTYLAIRAVLDAGLAAVRAGDDVPTLRERLADFVDAATRAEA